MYIAMNRFRVAFGSEGAFEHQWLTRESYLHRMPGFVEFHLLKGSERADHRLYSSYTLWATKQDFVNWTQSPEFKASHARTGVAKVSYLGHPEFEGFDVIQTVRPDATVLPAAE